jgi:general secretion pathway protein K
MQQREQDGVVLIVALWAVVLFSVIAAGLITLSRTERTIARNNLLLAGARAVADAGITKAIIALMTHDPAEAFRLDGTPQIVDFDGTQIEVSIQDELGKIDINFASEETLANLFVELGVDRGRANALAAAIADWRDEDDLLRANGAERDDYKRAGYLYGPANSAFRSPTEVERVLGFDREFAQKLEPFVTVFSRRSTVRPETASPLVLSASHIVGLSNAAPPRTDTLRNLAGRAFTVAAQAAQGTYERRVVIRFTDHPERPFLVQDWQ